jgi:hypothetical protein
MRSEEVFMQRLSVRLPRVVLDLVAVALVAAFQKAEAKGGCANSGHAMFFETTVDTFVNNVVACIGAHCG